MLDNLDLDSQHWINCVSCCWCAYQGDDEGILEIMKLFRENPHPHGNTWECMGCHIKRYGVKIT